MMELRDQTPTVIEHTTHLELVWPAGRGMVWATPEAVEGWVEQINALRSEVRRLEGESA